MTRMIHCVKLNKTAEGLDSPPYPGELGKQIFDTISKEAWQRWIAHQTLLINEKRLNLMDRQARIFLETELKKFLFEDTEEKPSGYTPI